MAVSDLGWPDRGSKLDDAFLVFAPFFSGGPIFGSLSEWDDFSGSKSPLAFDGGSEMCALVAVEWRE